MPYMTNLQLGHTNGEKLQAFPLRSGTRLECPLLPVLFNIVLEVLATAIRELKGKGNTNLKKRSLTVTADHMILYIEDPKDATRKLLELINEFCKVNTQKFVAFLYTNNERSEREIQEAILFTTALKRVKYLRINLPKKTKDLYSKNYKMLMKKN